MIAAVINKTGPELFSRSFYEARGGGRHKTFLGGGVKQSPEEKKAKKGGVDEGEKN